MSFDEHDVDYYTIYRYHLYDLLRKLIEEKTGRVKPTCSSCKYWMRIYRGVGWCYKFEEFTRENSNCCEVLERTHIKKNMEKHENLYSKDWL
ncbi:MAG: hypothetical protein DRJ31_07005 [Candidatus Methanomethylicota archaeon]|uniref:Uncharacterized protein n=1 Tax=Thermoproteota archaeon TaxID=2056631 RepID=A0A497EPD6_9CREN|nr:MAG: hypothetical protein DRJ31_07005 [Candidatus Verstraetearchaeota archaeon]